MSENVFWPQSKCTMQNAYGGLENMKWKSNVELSALSLIYSQVKGVEDRKETVLTARERPRDEKDMEV